MCIRDSDAPLRSPVGEAGDGTRRPRPEAGRPDGRAAAARCLLYTSDAADERSSVDLGGRRIIKKKNKIEMRSHASS